MTLQGSVRADRGCAVLLRVHDVIHRARDSRAPRAGRGHPWGRGLGEGLAERLGVGGLVGDRDLHPWGWSAVDGPSERLDVRGLAVDVVVSAIVSCCCRRPCCIIASASSDRDGAVLL